MTTAAAFSTRLLRGRASNPVWQRPALVALLLAAGALYLWGLGGSGWANAYYAAAAQAGGESWKAWFFGSFDAGNFITVDKPPASIWLMGLSVRLFGLSPWSILLPEALAGVASVGVLYATVRRWYGPAAGLLAGAVLATTPAATLMFRFNNPDALLVLLFVVACYAVTRAVEDGRTRWLVLAGACIGFGFLTKQLQAFIVVPALGITYLVAGPPRLGKRILQLLAALGALVVSASWYVAVVELWPSSSRPYIGGSQTNSLVELTLGYNGFGRLTGNQTGAVVPNGEPAPGSWGTTGVGRLFGAEMGTQASWLVPAALAAVVLLAVLAGRKPRTDRMRAFALLWGGWLVVTGAVFSFAAGIIHAYYTVALAPAIGALVGVGAVLTWRRRSGWLGTGVLAASVLGTAVWAWVLLGRAPDWQPWLRYAVLCTGILAALALLGARLVVGGYRGRMVTRLGVATAAVALVAVLAGPTAYSLQTAATDHSGAIPSAGPTQALPFGGRLTAGPAPAGGGGGGGRAAVGPRPGGADGGGAVRGGGAGGAAPPGERPGGGILGGAEVDDELVALLESGAPGYTWAAATTRGNSAAVLQLESGQPVMSIGGFNGTDPAPTLAEFQDLVAAGEVHYYVDNGGIGFAPSEEPRSEVVEWVEATFTKRTVGGHDVYDLTKPKDAG